MKANLIHGDCLDKMADIESGSIDMVLCDPPYGTTGCKWDSVIPFEPMWEQLKRLIKPNGAIVMTASQPFTTALIASNMEMFKYCWVWDKKAAGNHGLAKFQPLKTHEDVLVFSKQRHEYYPIKTKGKLRKKGGYGKGNSIATGMKEITPAMSGEYFPKSILEISNAVRKGKVHPTQKPIALMEYLVKTYTQPGETVLDFTMGSGTTGVACANLGRDFIGIEMDETYFKIACERISKAQSPLEELF